MTRQRIHQGISVFAAASVAAALLACPAPASARQHVVILLDDSGSMNTPMRSDRRTTRIQAAKAALETVLADLPAGTEVGLLVLNGLSDRGDRWVLPLGAHSRQDVQQAIRRMTAGWATPLGYYLKEAADALLQEREKNRYGTYRLLVVTDGEATDGDLLQKYLPDVLARGLTVDVIGVDMRRNHSLATQVHSYRRADDPAALQEGIAAVFAESDPANDAADADFALLEGFPPEIAAASLAALAQADNRPIGTPRPETADTVRPAQSDGPNGATTPPQPAGEAEHEEGGSGWLALVIALMIIFAIGFGRKVLRQH